MRHDHEIDEHAGPPLPTAGLIAWFEAPGTHCRREFRSRSESFDIDRQARVGRHRRRGELCVASVQVDGLSTNENHGVALRAQCVESIEEH
jgi:hypothetical protein